MELNLFEKWKPRCYSYNFVSRGLSFIYIFTDCCRRQFTTKRKEVRPRKSGSRSEKICKAKSLPAKTKTMLYRTHRQTNSRINILRIYVVLARAYMCGSRVKLLKNAYASNKPILSLTFTYFFFYFFYLKFCFTRQNAIVIVSVCGCTYCFSE